MGEYGHFLQLHNVVHSILCLNLVLLIMNHTIRPESGYEVEFYGKQFLFYFKVVDKNSCYVTIVTFHDSKESKIK